MYSGFLVLCVFWFSGTGFSALIYSFLFLYSGSCYKYNLFCSCFLQRFRESDARLQTDYERILYRKDERHPFTDCATGTVFQGIIRGINEDARLVVELNDGSSRTFAFKEISYII